MTTLADMTPQELANIAGMWCEDIYGDLFIYLGTPPGSTTRDEETGAPMGTFIDTRVPDTIEAPLAAFAARPDLPRTWNRDGQPPALNQYWTIEQASEYTQLSQRTLRRYIAEGRLVAYRAGRAIRLKPADIDAAFTHIKPNNQEET